MKKVLPNIVTFANLAFGMIAILIASGSKAGAAGWIYSMVDASLIIMIAALMDRLDGKIARALGVTSEFGKQLDSLSDMISFGVAPVVIAWKICLVNFGMIGFALCVLFTVSGAYRLARFNITEFDNTFRGMPITIAGAFLAIDNLYNCLNLINCRYTIVNSTITIILMVILPILMVSKLRVKKV